MDPLTPDSTAEPGETNGGGSEVGRDTHHAPHYLTTDIDAPPTFRPYRRNKFEGKSYHSS
jgi:hypothetical protein